MCKLDSTGYDDWLNNATYVWTEKDELQRTDFDIINKEVEKCDTKRQMKGGLLRLVDR